MYAIKVQDLYWMDHREMRDGRCYSYTPWTPDIDHAWLWQDHLIPDRIVTYWNTVHYERTQTIAGKPVTTYSAIGGVRVKDQAIVVTVPV